MLTDVVLGTSNENFQHVVCTLKSAEFFGPRLRERGIKLFELDLPGKRPWFSGAKKINPIVRDEKPDLILSWLYDATIASRMVILRNRKIPLITTLHASDYDPETIRAGNWPPRKMEAFRWIDLVTKKLTDPYFVACSRHVASSYEKRLGVKPARIRVLYNFIDPDSLKCAPEEPASVRRSFGIPENAFVYLNIGRLDPQKGQTYLLQAFQKVLAEAPDSYLVVIGEGNLEGSLKDEAAALNISSRVLFPGRRRDIGACLEMANAFVFPSLFEGLGIALVEAMAKNLPCIASRIEVLQEVIDENESGLLVEPSSVPELTRAMLRLYDDPELRRSLGSKAFNKVNAQFSSRVLLPQWENLYNEIS